MLDDDAFLSRLQATIASLRYWKPSISDAARVEESDADGVWKLTVTPHAAGACPFAIALSRDGHYSLTIDGEPHDSQKVESLDVFLTIADSIVEGRVLKRRWTTPMTGIETHVASVVTLPDGSAWSAINARAGARLAADATDGIAQDRHYLPFRRR